MVNTDLIKKIVAIAVFVLIILLICLFRFTPLTIEIDQSNDTIVGNWVDPAFNSNMGFVFLSIYTNGTWNINGDDIHINGTWVKVSHDNYNIILPNGTIAKAIHINTNPEEIHLSYDGQQALFTKLNMTPIIINVNKSN